MCCAALSFLLLSISGGTASAQSTVYIIRHGEKTFHAGCLDIQGQERANNLQNVFTGLGNLSKPTAIFANKYNYQPECERCWLTVQAIAQNLSLPVNFEHGYMPSVGGNKKAAEAIIKSAQTEPVILVSWEHYNIQFLAEALGVPKHRVPTWKGTDFDSVYVLELDDAGALVGFSITAQNHAPKSTTCPPNYIPPEPWMPHEAAPTHGFEDL